jgi:hypothetical protein
MVGFDIGVSVRAPQRFISKHFESLPQVTNAVFIAIPAPLGFGFSQDGIAGMYATPLVVFPFRVVYMVAHQSPLRRSPSSSVKLSAISLTMPSCVSLRDVMEVFSKRKVDYGGHRLRIFL